MCCDDFDDRLTMAMGLCDGLMQRAMAADDGISIATIDALQRHLDYLSEQDRRATEIAKGFVTDLQARKHDARVATLVDCANDVDEAHTEFEFRWREIIGLVRAWEAMDASPKVASIALAKT
jgi:predicted xylose isomerase-like sugar epimerase